MAGIYEVRIIIFPDKKIGLVKKLHLRYRTHSYTYINKGTPDGMRGDGSQGGTIFQAREGPE